MHNVYSYNLIVRANKIAYIIIIIKFIYTQRIKPLVSVNITQPEIKHEINK